MADCHIECYHLYVNRSYLPTGFTLIELLIAVSIIIVLAGFLVPNFSIYMSTQTIRQAQEQIKNDLRTVQNRAISGSGFSPTVNYWGVKFVDSANTYFYFTTDTASWNDCNAHSIGGVGSEKSVKLPGTAIIRNGTQCVYFAFADGGMTFFRNGAAVTSQASQIVTVGYTSSVNDCGGTQLNSAGLIKGLTAQTCELN